MSKTYVLNLGTRKAGLSDLRAQLVDSLGANSGSAISTGFVELSNGQYQWTYEVASSFQGAIRFYSNSDPTDVFVSVAVNPRSSAPASEDAETVNAYLYTRNASGVVTGSLVVSYRLLGVDDSYSGGSWNDDIQTVTSDADGLAEIQMARGAWYLYWVGDGRRKTVKIDSDTADPYELPTVTG